MADLSIRDKCSVNTNWDEDTFVGLRCEEGNFSVHFPLGFVIPVDDKELRKDIMVLLSVIGKTTSRKILRFKMKQEHIIAQHFHFKRICQLFGIFMKEDTIRIERFILQLLNVEK